MALYKATVDLLLDVLGGYDAGDVVSDFVTDDRILDWQYTPHGEPRPTDGGDFPDYQCAQYQAGCLGTSPINGQIIWEVYHLTSRSLRLVYASNEDEAIKQVEFERAFPNSGTAS